MKTVSALEVRAHFGELLDEAAAGERIVIERAGQLRAALVPLEDLRALDPAERLTRQRAALEEISRMDRPAWSVALGRHDGVRAGAPRAGDGERIAAGRAS